MNTKIVMTASSVTLGIAGVALTFAPNVLLKHMGFHDNIILVYLLQIIGSLYFAFAMLNWMTKSSLIGGIYNRPIALANFTHFLIAGLALSKGIIYNPNLTSLIVISGIIYVVFAVLFGILLFTHPISSSKTVR
jgi:hypothetical protein